MIGKIISHYRIIEKMAEGGLGSVYKAEDLNLKRNVALKLLPKYIVSDADYKEKFKHEAQIGSAINHVNTIRIYEIGETQEILFLSMEYIEGETLKKIIQENPLPLNEFFNIAIQIAQGLFAVHEKRIIHMNLNSTNIMIGNDGVVKLIDFTLAMPEDAITEKETDTMVGTLLYMSPEQIQGLPVDKRTDIYSLGVVLYEMLTGRAPFEKKFTEQELIYAKLNEVIEPPSELNLEIPKIVDKIIMKALEVDIKRRYQIMEQMLRDLMTGLVDTLLPEYGTLISLCLPNSRDMVYNQMFSSIRAHSFRLAIHSIARERRAFSFEHKLWKNVSIGFLLASVAVLGFFPILSMIGILGSIGLFSTVRIAIKKWEVKKWQS